jgi:hypothetical protein
VLSISDGRWASICEVETDHHGADERVADVDEGAGLLSQGSGDDGYAKGET